MRDFVLSFHSGWRYLVLVAIFASIVYFAYALAIRADNKRDRLFSMILGITYDIQILLGAILALLYAADDLFDSSRHLGHLMPMLLGIPMVHFYTLYPRFVRSANERTQRIIGLVAPIVVLILIVGGVASLELGLFEMT